MSDEVDMANDVAEAALQSSLRTIDTKPVAIATGHCLFCDEPLEDRRWCDADCASGWEKEQKRGK